MGGNDVYETGSPGWAHPRLWDRRSNCPVPAFSPVEGAAESLVYCQGGEKTVILTWKNISYYLLVYAPPVFEPVLSIWVDNYSKDVNLGDIYKQNQQENWSDKEQI